MSFVTLEDIFKKCGYTRITLQDNAHMFEKKIIHLWYDSVNKCIVETPLFNRIQDIRGAIHYSEMTAFTDKFDSKIIVTPSKVFQTMKKFGKTWNFDYAFDSSVIIKNVDDYNTFINAFSRYKNKKVKGYRLILQVDKDVKIKRLKPQKSIVLEQGTNCDTVKVKLESVLHKRKECHIEVCPKIKEFDEHNIKISVKTQNILISDDHTYVRSYPSCRFPHELLSACDFTITENDNDNMSIRNVWHYAKYPIVNVNPYYRYNSSAIKLARNIVDFGTVPNHIEYLFFNDIYSVPLSCSQYRLLKDIEINEDREKPLLIVVHTDQIFNNSHYLVEMMKRKKIIIEYRMLSFGKDLTSQVFDELNADDFVEFNLHNKIKSI
jgi:hypothetical protein